MRGVDPIEAGLLLASLRPMTAEEEPKWPGLVARGLAVSVPIGPDIAAKAGRPTDTMMIVPTDIGRTLARLSLEGVR